MRKSAVLLKKRERKTQCPLCKSWLLKGERVRTEAYPGNNKEKIVYLYGCPFCNRKDSRMKKICPVCRRVIPFHAYLVGKMWNEGGKTRVHVEGCSYCLKMSK